MFGLSLGLGLSSPAKGGVAAPLSDTPTIWSNTRENTATANYIRTAPFATVAYDTTATEITLNSYNDIYGTYPQFAELGLNVNGVYQSVLPGAAGARTNVITLAPGSKRIEIVNGLQSKPSSSIIGTFLVSISANSGLTRVFPTSGAATLVYGDSIAVGANATSPTGQGWPMLVRDAVPVTVGVEGNGFRSLYDDCVDATARAAFVAKIVAWNPSKLWISIGHNDYLLSLWTAANFQTAYAALLTDLNTALPSLQIIAQSPIVRNPNPTNAFGETLTNFRAAVLAAATGKAWVTYIDGLQILGNQSLDDGVHPTTDGHFGYAEFANLTLGYTTAPTSTVIANRANTTATVQSLTGLYRVEKTAGSNSFSNASAEGATGFAGDFTLKIVPRSPSTDILLGMNDDPSAAISINIDYSFYFQPSFVQVWEGGSLVASVANQNYDLRRPVWIVRRGTTLTYRVGFDLATATILRTVNSVSATLYVDSTLFQTGAIFDAGAYAA